MGARQQPVRSVEVARLSAALRAYALWIELDPSLYDADAVAYELERLGVLEPEEWRPAPWVEAAVAALRGADGPVERGLPALEAG